MWIVSKWITRCSAELADDHACVSSAVLRVEARHNELIVGRGRPAAINPCELWGGMPRHTLDMSRCLDFTSKGYDRHARANSAHHQIFHSAAMMA